MFEQVKFDERGLAPCVAQDFASGEVLTRAHTIQVAVEIASGEMLYQCPPVLWERLGVPAP